MDAVYMGPQRLLTFLIDALLWRYSPVPYETFLFIQIYYVVIIFKILWTEWLEEWRTTQGSVLPMQT